MYSKLLEIIVLVIIVCSKQTFARWKTHEISPITAKTYELQVPGSHPIRIIEAEPPWRTSRDTSKDTQNYANGVNQIIITKDTPEHRSIKKQLIGNKKIGNTPSTQETKTALIQPLGNKCYGISCGNEADASSSNDFQSDIAFVKLPDDDKVLPDERLPEVSATKDSNFNPKTPLDTTFVKLPDFNILKDRSLEIQNQRTGSRSNSEFNRKIMKKSDTSIEEDDEFGDKSSKISTFWNRVEVQSQKKPHDDNKGWVKLEVIPWSTTKISKWESNKQTDFPTHDKYVGAPSSVTTWTSPQSNRFDKYGDSPKGYQQGNNLFYSPNYQQDFAAEVPSKPSWNSMSHSNNYNSHNFGTQSNKPSDWDRNTAVYYGHGSTTFYQERPSSSHSSNEDCHEDHKFKPDIITDQRPAGFPSDRYETPYKRPGSSAVYSADFSTYRPSRPDTRPGPDSGEGGQWVLLSTTKGYQVPPKKRQRSLELRPDVLTSRRSVKLTVLPVENGSEINMTTSHGGLLQVESTFETVDDSRNNYIRKMKIKNNPSLIQHSDPLDSQASENVKKVTIIDTHIATGTNGVGLSSNNNNHKVSVPKQQVRPHKSMKIPLRTKSNAPDTNAILAAVGAGMVPATMAMVMPFVLGRKRRSTMWTQYQLPSSVVDDVRNNVTHTPIFEIESTLRRNLR